MTSGGLRETLASRPRSVCLVQRLSDGPLRVGCPQDQMQLGIRIITSAFQNKAGGQHLSGALQGRG